MIVAMVFGLAFNFTGCTKDDTTDPENPENPVTPPTPGIETLVSPITSNRTLPDLGLEIDYYINGTLHIEEDACLTIEPGVTIAFTDESGAIIVNESAAMKAIGTQEKPIIFRGTANNNNAGSWNYILYNSQRNDNQMEYVTLLNGGSTNSNDWGLLRVYGKMSMKNCTIDGGLQDGVQLSSGGYFTAFEGNTIKNMAKYPIWTSDVVSIKNFGANNTYTLNAKNFILVEGWSYLIEDYTLVKQSIPYYFSDGLSFRSDISVKATIQPGTQMLFGAGTNFLIANPVQIVAEGTVDEPIVIKGFENEIGFWNGVMMESERQGNIFNFCQMSGGGSDSGWTANHCLYLRSNSKTTITNTLISDSDYYGIVIENMADPDFRLTHANVGFTNCRLANVLDEYLDMTFEALP